MSIVITTRVPKKIADAIKYLSEEKKSDKAAVLRQLIEKGLREELIKLAIEKLKNKEVSIWKAAEIADLSLWEFIDELRKRKITLYDDEDLKKDIETLRRLQ
ncbi:MAG: UPF0175 family protein [Candidatus Asgardarchaeia archaeon]